MEKLFLDEELQKKTEQIYLLVDKVLNRKRKNCLRDRKFMII